MDLPTNLQAARLILQNKRPYISAVLWSLIPHKIDSVETLAVDPAHRLYFGSAAEQWEPDKAATALYHECWHLLNVHHERMPNDADTNIWNIAGDLEINDGIEEEGLNFPIDPLLPRQYKFPNNLTAEEYYERLKQIAQKVPQLKCKCGGASGNPNEGELEGSGGQGDKDKQPGITQAESDLIRRIVAADIQDAVNKGIGNMPGHLRRWADSVLHPQVPWQRVLRQRIKHVQAEVQGRFDYTFQRLPRRQSVARTLGVALPGTYSPKPIVRVVIDTSGSMSEKQLVQAVAEVAGILRSTGQPVDVLACDTAVDVSRKVMRVSAIKLTGGGGTDMSYGIKMAAEVKPRANLIIVLTDCLTGWPEAAPKGTKVVVCALGADDNSIKQIPAWASTVRVKL